ncbi:MAG TPA: hypothetical protein VFD36_18085, partial [Kofleriaceae bacterium]|nr:hypothetical protein [Kofleriaceae bacterium]
GVLPRGIEEPAATQPSDVLPWPGTARPPNVEAQACAPPAPAERAPDAVVAVDAPADSPPLVAVDAPADRRHLVAVDSTADRRRLVAVDSAAERRRRWLSIAAVDTLGMAAAGACIILGLATPDLRPSASAQLELAVNVEPVGPRVRGVSSAHVGDIVHASAEGGSGPRAIWVYHDERLVLACPGAPECRLTESATTVDVVLRASGRYTIVGVTSAGALPVPHGSYDNDTGGAQQAGAMTQIRLLEVR